MVTTIRKQRDGEDGGARRGSDGKDRDSGWLEGDERRQDGDGRQDGDECDWHQERDSGGYQGGYEERDSYDSGAED
jgi:hypothetical protein